MSKERKQEKKHRNARPKLRYILSFLAFMFCFLFTLKIHDIKAASYAKVINVKLKDGQDATTEIQKALDEAAKAGTKKKQAMVKVPAGTYLLSKSLVIGSNTYLKLDKKTYMKKNPNSKDPVAHMLHAVRGNKGGYSDNARITVDGGVWDTEFRQYNEKTSSSIFMFAHTNNLKILNVTLRNSFGTHLIELGGVKKVTIKNCTLYGYKAPSSDVEKEAIQFDNCHNDTILSYGEPFDDSPCTDVTVTNCEIYNYPRAVGSHTMVEGIYHKNIKIVNNSFHDIDDAAVYGYNYINLTVKGNKMENVGAGIQVKTDSVAKNTIVSRNKGVKAMKVSGNNFKLKITDNVITLKKTLDQSGADSGSSIGIFIYGSEKYPMKNVTISSNKITCHSSGIYLRYVDDAAISDNTVTRFSGAAAADGTKFAEDAIKLLASSGAKITGNTVSCASAPFENGIAMRDGSKNAVVSSNTITGAGKGGIALYSSSSIKSGDGNTISDTGANGIVVGGDCSVNLTGGTITNAGGKGINVMESGNLTVSGMTISGSTGRGIDIAGKSKVSISGCTIMSGSANGIFVDGDTDTTITGCTIKNNKGNAIQLKVGRVKITNNVFKDNCLSEADGKAVAVFGGISGEISNNTFSNPLTKSELWVSADASLSPYVSTMKTAKAYGTTDAAGNYYN
ncbi:MAG: right-handed parallel beta-helix repeat-containing protein [Lachnospiraceae bacterium]|nr:right-handed parallel beta-helix repeat-containing protein [Lachnospiraceae bacterium]